MPGVRVIRAEIPAGKATNSPPLGPALQQLGLDPSKVIEDINKATKKYSGHTVKIKIIVDLDTLKYDIITELPSTTDLLLKAVGVESPSGDPAKNKIGNISLEKIIEIALFKKKELNAKSLKAAVKTILGSARSIGLTVEGKDPKIVIKEIEQGLYDDLLRKYEDKWISE